MPTDLPIYIPDPDEPAAHVEEGVGTEWDIRLKNPNWKSAEPSNK